MFLNYTHPHTHAPWELTPINCYAFTHIVILKGSQSHVLTHTSTEYKSLYPQWHSFSSRKRTWPPLPSPHTSKMMASILNLPRTIESRVEWETEGETEAEKFLPLFHCVIIEINRNWKNIRRNEMIQKSQNKEMILFFNFKKYLLYIINASNFIFITQRSNCKISMCHMMGIERKPKCNPKKWKQINNNWMK